MPYGDDIMAPTSVLSRVRSSRDAYPAAGAEMTVPVGFQSFSGVLLLRALLLGVYSRPL